MSAQSIFDLAPIGSITGWSDSTPRPPERHRRKLAAWQTNNGQGRLIREPSARTVGSHTSPASSTLHEADHGGGGIITIRVQRSFQVGSALSFSVIERPTVGSVRIFDGPGPGAELVHLASDRAEAGIWLQHHGYPRAVLDEVTADEAATAAAGEERDAALRGLQPVGLLASLRLAVVLAQAAKVLPLYIVLCRASFVQVPRDLEEAAMVDGNSRAGAFFRIALPLARNGILISGVLVFLQSFGEYVYARSLIAQEPLQTATVGLQSFMGPNANDWTAVMTYAAIYVTPVLIVFMLLQRRIVSGLTAGALK